MIVNKSHPFPQPKEAVKRYLVQAAFTAASLLVGLTTVAFAQRRGVPVPIHARILQLEDERDVSNGELIRLLADHSAAVRERAALALGRIGDKRAIGALQESLRRDAVESVRLMAAFALGEIEDASSSDGLLQSLDDKTQPITIRARIIEALGKVGSLTPAETTLPEKITQRLLAELPSPSTKLMGEERLCVTLAITALMRLRSQAAVGPLADQLASSDIEVRAAAANALFRIRRPIGGTLPKLVTAASDADAIVRANAARALGLTAEGVAFEPLVTLLSDRDDRVRVNAIRGLAALGNEKASTHLIALGETLLATTRGRQSAEINLIVEIATALTALKAESSVPFLAKVRERTGVGANPEVEVALARLRPSTFLVAITKSGQLDWRQAVNVSQGLAEISSDESRKILVEMLALADGGAMNAMAIPALLRALRRVKYEGLSEQLKRKLAAKDPEIRGTAARILAETKDEETLTLLIGALQVSRSDSRNDARLATLDAIAGFKSERAIAAIQPLLKDRDYLVRRHAIEALWKLGVDRGSMRAEPVGAGRSRAFYDAVVRKAQRNVNAVLETDKGAITLRLFAEDAPLTVDNFVALARAKYFNGVSFHRVVANFVVQGGDPRGDGSGGPGHQIRCEVNLRPYERGALGMALSGKDTGGSQFFMTQSPQPHLDGGYTVFGEVASGMEVVDQIVRGDVIRRVTISTVNRRR